MNLNAAFYPTEYFDCLRFTLHIPMKLFFLLDLLVPVFTMLNATVFVSWIIFCPSAFPGNVLSIVSGSAL